MAKTTMKRDDAVDGPNCERAGLISRWFHDAFTMIMMVAGHVVAVAIWFRHRCEIETCAFETNGKSARLG